MYSPGLNPYVFLSVIAALLIPTVPSIFTFIWDFWPPNDLLRPSYRFVKPLVMFSVKIPEILLGVGVY